MTRRQLFIGALLPLASSLVVLPGYGDSATVVQWLCSLFRDLQAAAEAGSVYLQDRPEEKSATWLAEILFGSNVTRDLDADGQELLLARVRAARAADFCNEDLVVLNGWAVARTEARLLALLALCGQAA